MADQVAQASAFVVGTLLQALVQLPAQGGGDTLRLALKQLSARCSQGHWGSALRGINNYRSLLLIKPVQECLVKTVHFLLINDGDLGSRDLPGIAEVND